MHYLYGFVSISAVALDLSSLGAGSQSHTPSKWLKEARGSVIHARGKLKEELRRSRKRASGSRKRVSGLRKLEEARGSSRRLEEARGSVF